MTCPECLEPSHSTPPFCDRLFNSPQIPAKVQPAGEDEGGGDELETYVRREGRQVGTSPCNTGPVALQRSCRRTGIPPSSRPSQSTRTTHGTGTAPRCCCTAPRIPRRVKPSSQTHAAAAYVGLQRRSALSPCVAGNRAK